MTSYHKPLYSKKKVKKNSTYFVNHRRQKEEKEKKLTGDVDDVVVELVGEQRFRQLPEEGLEDHGCQVDVLHFSEVHALSYTRCREREKKKSLKQLKKTWIFEMAFARIFFFHCMPFADHNKENKEPNGRNNLTG